MTNQNVSFLDFKAHLPKVVEIVFMPNPFIGRRWFVGTVALVVDVTNVGSLAVIKRTFKQLPNSKTPYDIAFSYTIRNNHYQIVSILDRKLAKVRHYGLAHISTDIVGIPVMHLIIL